MSNQSATIESAVRITRDFSGATYTIAPSDRPWTQPEGEPPLDSVVRVFDPGGQVFTADPARVVHSDGPGDCTNQLRVEYITAGCGIQCNHEACGVNTVA